MPALNPQPAAAPDRRVSVPMLFPGATFVCLATGPSLTKADAAYCETRAGVTIAINDAYRLAPWANVLYACDAKWWRWHKGVPTFTGLKYALEAGAGRWPGVQVLHNTGRVGLETRAYGLRTGSNSGYQAINLARHLGARRILLLGYDMRGGHFFGQHPDGTAPPFAVCLSHFHSLVKPLAAEGIEVLNCSRHTALEAFPRVPLEEALP
jgi:hypothetical protein